MAIIKIPQFEKIKNSTKPDNLDEIEIEKVKKNPEAVPEDIIKKPRRSAKKGTIGEIKQMPIDVEASKDIKNSNYSTRTVDYHAPDPLFLTLVIILVAFGTVMIYSASYAQSVKDWGNPTYYFWQHLKFVGIGITVMFLIMFFVDYYFLKRFSKLLLHGAFLLLILVLVIGSVSGGSTRWLNLGVRFQPSEIAKVAVIFYLARFCEDMRNKMNRLSVSMTGFGFAVIPTAILLALEPHFSAIILITITAFVMVYAGGMNGKLFWGLVSVGACGAALFYFYGDKIPIDYISNRWHAWKDPASLAQDTGYQTIQSKLALGSGGLFGVGLGNSRQKQLFLPESHNDYILSIIGEELGFVGIVIIIILFALLLWRGIVIACRARDRFGFLITAGIMVQIELQVAINLAVVTNAIPVTGMALPFFSYGGTALLILFAEMGVILNVSRQTRLE